MTQADEVTLPVLHQLDIFSLHLPLIGISMADISKLLFEVLFDVICLSFTLIHLLYLYITLKLAIGRNPII